MSRYSNLAIWAVGEARRRRRMHVEVGASPALPGYGSSTGGSHPTVEAPARRATQPGASRS